VIAIGMGLASNAAANRVSDARSWRDTLNGSGRDGAADDVRLVLRDRSVPSTGASSLNQTLPHHGRAHDEARRRAMRLAARTALWSKRAESSSVQE
jgi:hypothetical protein